MLGATEGNRQREYTVGFVWQNVVEFRVYCVRFVVLLEDKRKLKRWSAGANHHAW